MKDTSSHISQKQLASYDQATSSRRTSEDISASDLKKFLHALPQSGMTQDGNLLELPMQGRHTSEQGCSLLPTPTVMHVRNHDEPLEVFKARQERSSTGQIGQSTGVAITLLATPTTNISHTTGKCRNWGADLLHDVKCTCKKRLMHWIKTEN